MKFDQNPQLRKELLDRLRSKYLTPRPDMPHLSEVMYCLTRSYFDRTDPIPPSEAELLLFSVGFGLEEVLLRDQTSLAPVTSYLDGLWLTPDYVALAGGELDLKTTRMGLKRLGEDMHGVPETWLEQFKAYAYKMAQSPVTDLPETVPYSVGVLLLASVPPELVVGTFTFTKQELLDNWFRIQSRKAVYMAHFEIKTPPEPFKWNRDWECKSCRYLIRCTTISHEEKSSAKV